MRKFINLLLIVVFLFGSSGNMAYSSNGDNKLYEMLLDDMYYPVAKYKNEIILHKNVNSPESFICIDIQTGKSCWEGSDNDLKKTIAFFSDFLQLDDLLILNDTKNKEIICYDLSTGNRKWHKKLADADYYFKKISNDKFVAYQDEIIVDGIIINIVNAIDGGLIDTITINDYIGKTKNKAYHRIIDANQNFVLFDVSGYMQCYDLNRGKIIWNKKYGLESPWLGKAIIYGNSVLYSIGISNDFPLVDDYLIRILSIESGESIDFFPGSPQFYIENDYLYYFCRKKDIIDNRKYFYINKYNLKTHSLIKSYTDNYIYIPILGLFKSEYGLICLNVKKNQDNASREIMVYDNNLEIICAMSLDYLSFDYYLYDDYILYFIRDKNKIGNDIPKYVCYKIPFKKYTNKNALYMLKWLLSFILFQLKGLP